MSFSQQVKAEVAAREIVAPCCVQAACYGVACFGKYFDSRGVVLHTESRRVAEWVLEMYRRAGIRGQLTPRGEPAHTMEFAVKEPYEVEKLLALFAHTGDETAVRINTENLVCDGCFACFVAAAFLCAGVVTDPEKSYMLEFVSGRYNLMQDFAGLLRQHGFLPKLTRRNGANVLYFKASEQIEDVLTLTGAVKSSLEIMNLKVYKDFRNRANRITNCETANIDKIVLANRQIVEAIQYLEECGALEALPPAQQQAAALRRDNPDMSLAELAVLSAEPVSKSGLNHRYRAILAHARRLKEAEKAK